MVVRQSWRRQIEWKTGKECQSRRKQWAVREADVTERAGKRDLRGLSDPFGRRETEEGRRRRRKRLTGESQLEI